jgi:uracil-DNA glycosylase family 4
LADEWRRYLEQQIELGGAEVVLGRTVGQAVRRSDERSVGSPALQESVPTSTDRPTARPAVSPSTRPPVHPSTWRKGAPPIPGPGLSVESPEHNLLGDDLVDLATLEDVAQRITGCRACSLCSGRTHAVPGQGPSHARLFLVGEGPGATEDAQGLAFVGQAGNLLTGILDAIEVPRESVYITNIVKCRPPQNRKPLPDEIAACMPYLHRQLELIRPKVIVALGGTAGEALLGVRKSLGELRGKVHTYNGIPLIVTYHPAALLRNPNWKKPTWDDVRIARQLLDR